MELRVLGSSGVKVSPICLGTMLFGDQTNEKQLLPSLLWHEMRASTLLIRQMCT